MSPSNLRPVLSDDFDELIKIARSNTGIASEVVALLDAGVPIVCLEDGTLNLPRELRAFLK